jgi:hypothetical protein
LRGIIGAVQVGPVKIYVAAVEAALRKTDRQADNHQLIMVFRVSPCQSTYPEPGEPISSLKFLKDQKPGIILF